MNPLSNRFNGVKKARQQSRDLGENVRDMMEYTALRAWVKEWLTYLRWYHLSAWSLFLQDFFEAPVVNRKWKTESTDPTLVRFGLLWKVYDWLADKGLDYKVPILDTTPSLNCVCVKVLW